MIKRRSIWTYTIAMVTGLTLAACGGATESDGGGEEASGSGLPERVVISTYPNGTGTYADVAAMAEAVTRAEGTQFRIIGSDTGLGRLTPLVEEQADFARTGEEYIYAFEGEAAFASEDWGPQDVQVAWSPLTAIGFAVREDSDIESFEDLEGKKVPLIIGNESARAKLDAVVKHGGLTWDDVTPVEVGYSEQFDALANGQIDMMGAAIAGPSFDELASKVDFRWLPFNDDSEDAMARLHSNSTSYEVKEFSDAPQLDEGESAEGLFYSLPLVVYGDADEEKVYQMVKTMMENFDDFKDVTETTPLWATDQAWLAPREVPFHPGVIRFLEEEGLWTDEAAARNDELLERGDQLRSGWEEFIPTADPSTLAAEWETWKQENMSSSE